MRWFAAVALLLLAPGCAKAATVTSAMRLAEDRAGPFYIQTVTFTAAPGERNDVEVASSPGNLRIHDRAGITASRPCSSPDPQTAVCPVVGTLTVPVELGDGDDRLIDTTTTVVVDGADGDDTIDAGGGSAQGGPGDDALRGAGTLAGGPGADVLIPTGKLATVSYADHAEGIRLDLHGDDHAGAPGENDHVGPGFRTAIGGSGDDLIVAGEHSAWIEGGAGADQLLGGPSGDHLEGDDGFDVLLGGAGSDELLGSGLKDDGKGDRIWGGRGHDYLLGGKGADLLDGGPDPDRIEGKGGADQLRARDASRDLVECQDDLDPPLGGDHADVDSRDVALSCEHIARSGPARLELHALVPIGRRAVGVLLSCPARARRACAGRLRVNGFTRGGDFTLRRRVRLAPGRRATVRLRLPGRRTLVRTSFGARLTTRDASGRRIVAGADLEGPRRPSDARRSVWTDRAGVCTVSPPHGDRW